METRKSESETRDEFLPERRNTEKTKKTYHRARDALPRPSSAPRFPRARCCCCCCCYYSSASRENSSSAPAGFRWSLCVSREKQVSETDVLSLVARKSVVSSGASRECARRFLFKTTAFRVFSSLSPREMALFSRTTTPATNFMTRACVSWLVAPRGSFFFAEEFN